MADLAYPHGKGAQLGLGSKGGPVDWDGDVFYGLLVTATYVVSVADATKKTHDFRDDLTGEVAAGGGYTTGGMVISSITITQSGDNYIVDAPDLVWSSASFTARGLVIFKRVGADLTTPADDPLMLLLDFGADKTASGGNFTVQFNASGIVVLS